MKKSELKKIGMIREYAKWKKGLQTGQDVIGILPIGQKVKISDNAFPIKYRHLEGKVVSIVQTEPAVLYDVDFGICREYFFEGEIKVLRLK